MSKDNFKEKLAQVDQRVSVLKKQISLGDDLEGLHNDERFQRVFLDGYFDVEAFRLFELLTEPTALKREQLENVMDKLGSIRNLKTYIKTLLINASVAPEQIEEEENYRKEITASNSLAVEKE